MPPTVPADPKQARSRQTKEKIVQAAIRLFETNGYGKTTSIDIAADAGVSVGSFYVYFTDKRQVLLAIFDRLADELFKNSFDSFRIEHLFDSDLRARIRQAVATAIVDRRQHAGLHRVIGELVLKDPEFAEKRKALMGRSIAKIREIITVSLKAGLTWELDVDAATFVVHRVVFDLSQDYVTGSCEFDQDKAISALGDMIYRFLYKPKE